MEKNVELKVTPETMQEMQRRAQSGEGFNLKVDQDFTVAAVPIRHDEVPHLTTTDISRLAKPMRSPDDYLHILVWGQRLQSFLPYIKDQQRRAAEAGAPINAVYERHDCGGGTGKWVTSDDCHPDVKAEVNDEVQRILDSRKS